MAPISYIYILNPNDITMNKRRVETKPEENTKSSYWCDIVVSIRLESAPLILNVLKRKG